MFTIKPLLKSDKLYKIQIDIELASNVPTHAVGIGGAPGESVYLKAGASPIEPGDDLLIFPNPANGLLNIQSQAGKIKSIGLFTQDGRLSSDNGGSRIYLRIRLLISL